MRGYNYYRKGLQDKIIRCDTMMDVRVLESIIVDYAVRKTINDWITEGFLGYYDMESHSRSDLDYEGCFEESPAYFEVDIKNNVIYLLATNPEGIDKAKIINCKKLYEYNLLVSSYDYTYFKNKGLSYIKNLVNQQKEYINNQK